MKFETVNNILWGLILVLVYHTTHEFTHYRIFQYYDCKEIIVNWFSIGANSCMDGVILANSINEVVGYTVVPFLVLLVYLVGRE